MKSFLIGILLVFGAAVSNAHNPLLATFTLEKIGDNWLLHISMAQSGVHSALKKYSKELDVENMDEAAYKQVFVDHILTRTRIKVNGDTELTLGEGGIRLGGHQSDAKFIIKGMPKEVKTIEFKINCFKENEGHANILKVVSGTLAAKTVLNARNGYQATASAAAGWFQFGSTK